MAVLMLPLTVLSLLFAQSPATHRPKVNPAEVEFVFTPRTLISDTNFELLIAPIPNGPAIHLHPSDSVTQTLPPGAWTVTANLNGHKLVSTSLDLNPGEQRKVWLFDELKPWEGPVQKWEPKRGRASIWTEEPLEPVQVYSVLPMGLDSYDPEFAHPEGHWGAFELSDALPYTKGRLSLNAFPGFMDDDPPQIWAFLANDSDHIETLPWNSNLIMEAQDSGGTWRPIEGFKESWGVCGVGLKPIIIPVHGGFYLKARKYTGTFQTHLRLAIDVEGGRILHSNEFEGSINPGQIIRTDKSSAQSAPPTGHQ